MAWSTLSPFPSFLAFAPAQPFRLPSLAPWLCPAACTGFWGLPLLPAPRRCPLCLALPADPHRAPASHGGGAHPAPPDLQPQLLVSPGFARLCGGRWGHHTGGGSHLGVTFVAPSFWAHSTLPTPEGHEVLGSCLGSLHLVPMSSRGPFPFPSFPRAFCFCWYWSPVSLPNFGSQWSPRAPMALSPPGFDCHPSVAGPSAT